MIGDFGDLDDLSFRVHDAVESGAKIVLVLGAGISVGAAPSTSEFVEIFRGQLDSASRLQLDEFARSSEAPADLFQAAAQKLQVRKGHNGLAAAVRLGVLRACNTLTDEERRSIAVDRGQCTDMEQRGKWTVPPAISHLVQFYGKIPTISRGGIITTNFDPLIELSFREAGVATDPIPIPMDSPPSLTDRATQSNMYVHHIHGYWTSSTLSTLSQLRRSRPSLSGFLRNTIANSIVLVVGYGGWVDEFSGTLLQLFREGDSNGCEVLWATFGLTDQQIEGHSYVKSLIGLPCVNIYKNIDAQELFSRLAQDKGLPSPRAAEPAPPGYSLVDSTLRDFQSQSLPFADGGQPKWKDAIDDQVPLLTNTLYLHQLTESLLAGETTKRGVAAVGPVGEGKSMGLRQVAVRVASGRPEWTVVFREVDAPPLSPEWLEGVAGRYDNLLVCIDDADLVLPQLRGIETLPKNVKLLLAVNDRAWDSWNAPFRSGVIDVRFEGIDERDAGLICSYWEAVGGEDSASSVEAIQLLEASISREGGSRSTLLGAVLSVRVGSKLRSRVNELLKKLSLIKVSVDGEITLDRVYIGICLLETVYSRATVGTRGASRSLISGMVGLDSGFVEARVLSQLGREAAVSFVQNWVFARHLSIAQVVVDLSREQGTMVEVCRIVGRAGAALRLEQFEDRVEYSGAFLLSRRLEIEPEVVAAAQGAAKQAPDLLEAQVSYLRATRRFHPEIAVKGFRTLRQDLSHFDDLSGSMRGFLVEGAHCCIAVGEDQEALALASLSIADGVGFAISREQASYGLWACFVATSRLRIQSPRRYPLLSENLMELGCRIERKFAQRVKAHHRQVLNASSGVGSRSTVSICSFITGMLAADISRHYPSLPKLLRPTIFAIDGVRQLAESGSAGVV